MSSPPLPRWILSYREPDASDPLLWHHRLIDFYGTEASAKAVEYRVRGLHPSGSSFHLVKARD